jgi:hypothetical protein
MRIGQMDKKREKGGDERRMCADPGHDGAKVAEQTAVESRECTAGEGELGCAVVGEDRVGVLQERDEHKPVVDPTIR